MRETHSSVFSIADLFSNHDKQVKNDASRKWITTSLPLEQINCEDQTSPCFYTYGGYMYCIKIMSGNTESSRMTRVKNRPDLNQLVNRTGCVVTGGGAD